MSPRSALGKLLLALVTLLARGADSVAQNPAPQTAPVLMISDIHLDPFHDPAKFARLRSSPVRDWAKILDAPESPNQAREYESLQKTCRARGVDPDWDLFSESLRAERAQQPEPLFITVSGDLMAHDFECRFHTLAPGLSPSDYTAFTEKTVAFVALQFRLAFPRVPVYLALGNNDSSCGDFQETPHSAFLASVAQSFADDVDPASRETVLREFPEQGDYDIALPRPMANTRLIVLQDIFQSYRYRTCGGAADTAAAKTQIAWLAKHLAAAREHGENVWVMTHIPPGVNVHSTSVHGVRFCTGALRMNLSSPALPDTLVRFSDEVRLLILGHAHTDEIRILAASTCTEGSGACVAIPVKLIPSITPVDGNNPAFLMAAVDPRSSILIDYNVFAADGHAGTDLRWQREYRYSEAYGLPDFSAASVERLVSRFAADKTGTSVASRNYQRWYSVGASATRGVALQRVWRAYVCGISEYQEQDFRGCMCSAADPELK